MPTFTVWYMGTKTVSVVPGADLVVEEEVEEVEEEEEAVEDEEEEEIEEEIEEEKKEDESPLPVIMSDMLEKHHRQNGIAKRKIPTADKKRLGSLVKPRKYATSAAHRKYKHPSNQPRVYVMVDTLKTKKTKTAAVLPVRDCLD